MPKAIHHAASPSLTWSNSQYETFLGCRREWYWKHVLAPTGGYASALEIARVAYRLKTLTALPLEVGRVLHERAKELAIAVQKSDPLPTLVTLRQRNRARLNHVWVSSRDHADAWRRYPKDIPMLREWYYHGCPSDAEIGRTKARLERGIVTLRSLDLWSELGGGNPRDILLIDKLDSYVLPARDGVGPIEVWAAPDLVWRPDPDAAPEVVDHKTSACPPGGTGASGSALRRDVEQVIGYTVGLRVSGKLAPGEGCGGRLIYLGDGTDMSFPITPSDIDAAEQRIRDGAVAMDAAREAAAQQATNAVSAARAAGCSSAEVAAAAERARRATFPMTTDWRRCGSCPFAELCAPEQRQRDGAVDVPDAPAAEEVAPAA